MVCNPEAQKNAQTEFDNVLNGKLPEHIDIFSLPYLSALVKEVIRYVTVRNLFLHAKLVCFLCVGACIKTNYRPLFLQYIGGGNKLASLFRQGIPHLSTNDDLHDYYHISIVIPNQW